MPRTATFTLTILGLGLATTAAHANSGIVRTCTSPDGAAVSCPVDLVEGHDYLLLRHGDGTAGRVELVQKTGMMSFPQVVVGDEVLGGFREVLEADENGRLEELLAA